MVRKRYDTAQKQQAVALAAIIGAEAAGEQLGIDSRTIRSWSEAAGKAPADAIAPATWTSLMEVSLARVQAQVAAGNLPARTLAIIAGIAKRNSDRERKPFDEPTAVDAQDAFLDWCFTTLPELQDDAMPDHDEAIAEYLALVEAAFGTLHGELLTRANAEQAASYRGLDGEPFGHRAALLAWHSGRTEVPAGDIVEWCRQQTSEILAEHGSLFALHRWDAAMKYRESVIQQRADVLWREAGMRLHDALDFAREHLSDDLPVPTKGTA